MGDILNFIGEIIRIILLIIIVRAAIPLFGERLERHSHDVKSFEGFNFSPTLFYSMTQKAIDKRGLKMEYSVVPYLEGTILSHTRDYLRIEFDNYVYLICAAPLGTGYFISTRQFTKLTRLQIFLKHLPFFNKIHWKKTYFEEDVEAMFRSAAQAGVQEAMNEMTNVKGMLQEDIGPLPNEGGQAKATSEILS